MDFNFTEEQDMVRDGLSRMVREQYDWENEQKTEIQKLMSSWS